ncbi:MAG TPA: cytochrome c3 family protein [Blastocatellia bacterium]|nr:cytochrome c3 family protein [Blastocatellia bacterium]
MTSGTIKKSMLAVACLLAALAWAGGAPSLADSSPAFVITQQTGRDARPNFPHDQKKHREIPCARCHLATKTERSDQPMAKNFPHASCIGCHNFAQEFFKIALGGTSRFCGVCHEPRRITGGDKALRPGVLKPATSDFFDQFSHEAHFYEEGTRNRLAVPAFVRVVPMSTGYGSQFRTGEIVRCTDCHSPLRRVSEGKIDMQTQKDHPSCFVCHGGPAPAQRRVAAEKFPYENDCGVCHKLKDTNPGLAFHHLFMSIKGFRHEDHDIDIRPKKKSEFPLSTAPDRLCVECHEPVDRAKQLADVGLPKVGYCDRCHIDRKPGLPARLSDDIRNKLRAD